MIQIPSLPPTYLWQRKRWPALEFRIADLAAPLVRAHRAQSRLWGAVQMIEPEARSEAAGAAMAQESMASASLDCLDWSSEAVNAFLGRLEALEPHQGGQGKPGDGPLTSLLRECLQGRKQPLTLERILSWHRLLLSDGGSGGPGGDLRGDEPVEVVTTLVREDEVETIRYAPPGRDRLEGDLKAFLAWFNGHSRFLDPLLRAGMAYLWLLTVHPVEKGNGRLARLVMNMAVAFDEPSDACFYSLSSQFRHEVGAYQEALARAQCGGTDVTNWLIWFLEQVGAAAERGLQDVHALLARRAYWTAVEASSLNERQAKALEHFLDLDGTEELNNRTYLQITDSNRTTAARDLADLVEQGFLVPMGAGRSRTYRLALDEYRGEFWKPKAGA